MKEKRVQAMSSVRRFSTPCGLSMRREQSAYLLDMLIAARETLGFV